MTKSTAIIFIMGFALLFKLEKKHWSLLAVVVMISGGLIMFTYKATQFNLIGFLMVLSASFLRFCPKSFSCKSPNSLLILLLVVCGGLCLRW